MFCKKYIPFKNMENRYIKNTFTKPLVLMFDQRFLYIFIKKIDING